MYVSYFYSSVLCLKNVLSSLFNRRGWNKRGGEAKIAKSLNVEAGKNV